MAYTVPRAGVTPRGGGDTLPPSRFLSPCPRRWRRGSSATPCLPSPRPPGPSETPCLHFAGVGQLVPGCSPTGATLLPLMPTVSPLPDRQAAAAAHPAAAQNQPAAATDPGKGGGHLPMSPFPCWVIAAPSCAGLVSPPGARQGDGTCLQRPAVVIGALCFSPPLPSSRSTCPTS